MPLTAAAVLRDLKSKINPEKAAFLPRFFQSGPGQYAEGDQFLGVVVPDQRRIARQYRDLPRTEIDKLLANRYHECRLTGLLILVDQFAGCRHAETRQQLVDYYLARTEAINNWDLVDASAHKILGAWLSERQDRRILDRLADSHSLWEQRIAVVATYTLIQRGELHDTLRLAEKLMCHSHELIHKAVGWMLREVGKQDPQVLIAFLDQHVADMPRTMLRYAIERLPAVQRQHYLSQTRRHRKPGGPTGPRKHR